MRLQRYSHSLKEEHVPFKDKMRCRDPLRMPNNKKVLCGVAEHIESSTRV